MQLAILKRHRVRKQRDLAATAKKAIVAAAPPL